MLDDRAKQARLQSKMGEFEKQNGRNYLPISPILFFIFISIRLYYASIHTYIIRIIRMH